MVYILSEAATIACDGYNSHEEHNGYDFLKQGWLHMLR